MTPNIEDPQQPTTTSTLDDSEADLLAPAVQRTDADIEAQADKVKEWMWDAVTNPDSDYIGAGQEVQSTQLAENAALHFWLYYDDVDFKIPDVVFDWAYEMASAYESRRDNDGEES